MQLLCPEVPQKLKTAGLVGMAQLDGATSRSRGLWVPPIVGAHAIRDRSMLLSFLNVSLLLSIKTINSMSSGHDFKS